MMDKGIVDCFLRTEEEFHKTGEHVVMSKALRDFMLENGTLSYLEGHEVYTYLMKFRDDSDEAFSKEMLQESDMNTDVSTMTETELFNYLRGQYLLGRRMEHLVRGFSAIQVEQY